MNLAELTIKHRRILDSIQELDRHASHSDERIKALHQLAIDLNASSADICLALADERIKRLQEVA